MVFERCGCFHTSKSLWTEVHKVSCFWHQKLFALFKINNSRLNVLNLYIGNGSFQVKSCKNMFFWYLFVREISELVGVDIGMFCSQILELKANQKLYSNARNVHLLRHFAYSALKCCFSTDKVRYDWSYITACRMSFIEH